MWHHFFPLLFPKDSESLKILNIRLREVGAKRPLNSTSRSEHTHRQTHGRTNRLIESIGPEARCFENTFVVGHSMRLNAEVADTASQKSFWPFCKFWCQNLNYRKIYIFIGHMFFKEKSTFSCWKAVKCSHQYPKMG